MSFVTAFSVVSLGLLSGSGSLLVASLVAASGSGAFAGSGDLSVSAVARVESSVALAGDGTLIVAGALAPQVTIDLAGSGALTYVAVAYLVRYDITVHSLALRVGFSAYSLYTEERTAVLRTGYTGIAYRDPALTARTGHASYTGFAHRDTTVVP